MRSIPIILLFFFEISCVNSQTLGSLLNEYNNQNNPVIRVQNKEVNCIDSISLENTFTISKTSVIFGKIEFSNIYLLKIIESDTLYNQGFIYKKDDVILYFSFSSDSNPYIHSHNLPVRSGGSLKNIYSISELDCNLRVKNIAFFSGGKFQYLLKNVIGQSAEVIFLSQDSITINNDSTIAELYNYLNNSNYYPISIFEPMLNLNFIDYSWVEGNKFQNKLLIPSK